MLAKKQGHCQIFEKSYVHSRGHSFDPKFMEFGQNVNPYKI